MRLLDPKYLLKKLDFVFDSLKFGAKLNVEFGFVLKNVEDGVVGIIMHKKNLHYWSVLSLWLLQKTW